MNRKWKYNKSSSITFLLIGMLWCDTQGETSLFEGHVSQTKIETIPLSKTNIAMEYPHFQ